MIGNFPRLSLSRLENLILTHLFHLVVVLRGRKKVPSSSFAVLSRLYCEEEDARAREEAKKTRIRIILCNDRYSSSSSLRRSFLFASDCRERLAVSLSHRRVLKRREEEERRKGKLLYRCANLNRSWRWVELLLARLLIMFFSSSDETFVMPLALLSFFLSSISPLVLTGNTSADRERERERKIVHSWNKRTELIRKPISTR